MNEKKKLTDEEINSISEIRQKTSEKIMQFGEIELELIYLAKRKDQLLEAKKNYEHELEEIRKSEFDLSKNLEQKYGQGTLNLDSGEFLPV